jgi:hypothetical protein
MHDEKHQEWIIKYLAKDLQAEEEPETYESIKNCTVCQSELEHLKNVLVSIKQLKGDDVVALLEKNDELRKILESPPKHGAIDPDEAERALASCRESFHQALAAGRPDSTSAVYPFGAFLMWRNLAFALAAILVLIIPIGSYKLVVLQKELKSQEARRQKILDKNEKKDQMISEIEAKIAGSEKKTAELLQESQKQKGQIMELTQLLEKYRKPDPNAFFQAEVSASRQGEDVKRIDPPKSALYICLQVNVSEFEEKYKTYRLVIKDSTGRTVSENHSAQRENNAFKHYVARDLLKPGDYELQIYGRAGGTERLLTQNRFRILSS